MTVSTETLCFQSLYSSLEKQALHFSLFDFISNELKIRKRDLTHSIEANFCLGVIDSKLERFGSCSKTPLSPVRNLPAGKEAEVSGREVTKESFPNLDGFGSKLEHLNYCVGQYYKKDVDVLKHKSSPTVLKRKGKYIAFQDSSRDTEVLGIADGFESIDSFPLASASTRQSSTAGHSLSCQFSLQGNPIFRRPFISGNVVMEEKKCLHLQGPSKSRGLLHGLQTADLCAPKDEHDSFEYQVTSEEKPRENISSDLAECSINSHFFSKMKARGETAETVSPGLRIELDESSNIDDTTFINHVATETGYAESLVVTHQDPFNDTEKESRCVLPSATIANGGGSVVEPESNSHSSQNLGLPGKMIKAEIAPGVLWDGMENGEYEGLNAKGDVKILKEKDQNGDLLLKKDYHPDDLQEVVESLNERGVNIGAVDKSCVANCSKGVDEHLCSSTMDQGQRFPKIWNAANPLSPKGEIHVEQQTVEAESFGKLDSSEANDVKARSRIKIENFSEEFPSAGFIQGASLEAFLAQGGSAQCVDMAHDITHKQGFNGFSMTFLANKETFSMIPFVKQDLETFNGINSCRSKNPSAKNGSFENVAVEVVACNTAEDLRPDSEDQATECSSSFEGTDSDTSGHAACVWEDSDEANSMMRDGNGAVFPSIDGAEIVHRKKKPLTPEWKAYRRGIEWRCRWLELRIKEVHSQMAKYDGVLQHIKDKKYGNQKGLESAAARTCSLIELNQSSRILRRKQRQRVEDVNDLSSHMFKHPLFSRYEKKERSNVEEMSTAEATYVQHIQSTHSDCVAAESQMPEEQDIEDELEKNNVMSDHDSMEQLMWDIESLQMHIVKLKNQLSRGASASRQFFKLQLKGQTVSSPRSSSYFPVLASPRNSRVLNQSQGLGTRLFSSGPSTKLHSSSVSRRRNSDYDINNVVMPGNIMATYVEPARHAFIETPQWRVLEDVVRNQSNENSSSEEETDEELYIAQHAEMETKERQHRYIPRSCKIASYGKGILKRGVKGLGKAIGQEKVSSPEEILLEDTFGPLQLNFGFVPKGKRRKRDPRCGAVPVKESESSFSQTAATSVHSIV